MRATLFLTVILALASCRQDETISGYLPEESSWKLSEIDNAPYEAAAVITFPEEGKITGEGPCNSFTAEQTAPYPWIAVEQMALTRRACPALDAENAFVTALTGMTLAEVSGDVLLLSNDEGRTLLFVRVTPDG